MPSHSSPTGFTARVLRSQCAKFPGVVSQTYLYNILNFPVGAVSVDTVTEENEEVLKLFKDTIVISGKRKAF